jgi:hypothetical protein
MREPKRRHCVGYPPRIERRTVALEHVEVLNDVSVDRTNLGVDDVDAERVKRTERPVKRVIGERARDLKDRLPSLSGAEQTNGGALGHFCEPGVWSRTARRTQFK